MIGEHNFWKQREPSSVAKIQAEVKNVTQELSDIDAEQQRRGAILYGKHHGISQQAAQDILSQDPSLFNEWANK